MIRVAAGRHLLTLALSLAALGATASDGVLLHAENPARWREATLSCGTDYRFDELPAAFGVTSVRITAGTPEAEVLWSGRPSERSVLRLGAVCRRQAGTASVLYIVEGPVPRSGIAYRLVPERPPGSETAAGRSSEPARRLDIAGRWRCESDGLTSFAVLDAAGGVVSLVRTIDDKGLDMSVDCVGRWREDAGDRVSALMNCTTEQGRDSSRFSVTGSAWLRDPMTLEWRGQDGVVSLCRRTVD